MGKISLSEGIIKEIRKIAGKQQSLDGNNWTDEMTMYHILDKYKEYENTQTEQEIERIREDEDVQELSSTVKKKKPRQ